MLLIRSIMGGTALCAFVALVTPASAQTQGAAGPTKSDNPMSMGINFDKPQADEETRQKRREIEEAYQRTTKSQPAAQTTAVNDPWANMRGTEPPKAMQPAPKTAQKKKPAQ